MLQNILKIMNILKMVTSNEPKIKEEQKNSENINSINIKEENKSISNEINTNLNINQEISKKEEKKNIINDEEGKRIPILGTYPSS